MYSCLFFIQIERLLVCGQGKPISMLKAFSYAERLITVSRKKDHIVAAVLSLHGYTVRF